MALGWTFLLVLSKYKFLKSYFTGKEGRRDCTLLYYCVQSSDYLRCVDILNHKITPLIRLLIIQKCPMRKQTLSQEFRQNNIKSLRKLVNYHSPIVFIFIYIYLFSIERAGHHDCPLFYYSLFCSIWNRDFLVLCY